PGLIHAFGFSGHGFQLGPGTGAVLAELALDGQTDTNITGLRITRFAKESTTHPLAERHPA
ncbi:MAG: FAD-binding oxidoreductase, partial [Gammaproteobacteria bacterium]